jgi:hypothetical protein
MAPPEVSGRRCSVQDSGWIKITNVEKNVFFPSLKITKGRKRCASLFEVLKGWMMALIGEW